MANALFDCAYFQRVFNQKEVASDKMQNRIKLWFDLYFDELPESHLKPIDPLERVPYIIVDGITKTVFTEYEASFASNSRKEQLLGASLEQLNDLKEEAIQFAQIGSECLLKPIPNLKTGTFDVSVINRLNYVVLATDAKGNITAVGTAEYFERGNSYFTVLERRFVDGQGYLTIETKIYRSTVKDALGYELTEVERLQLPEYAEIPTAITYSTPVHSVGLVRVRMRKANCVDNTKFPVSIYAVSERSIYQMYRHEHLYDCAFELGQTRVIASKDYLDDALSAMTGRSQLIDNILLPVDDAPKNVGITVVSPDIQADAYEKRKTSLGRTIENQIGLRPGMIADVQRVERTATEVNTNKNRFNATVEEIGHVWRQSVIMFLRTCDALGRIFFPQSWGALGYTEPKISFGDGVLYDREQVWAEYVQMVVNGWLKPELALAWYFNLPHETEKDIARIRKNYMPVIRGIKYGMSAPDFMTNVVKGNESEGTAVNVDANASTD